MAGDELRGVGLMAAGELDLTDFMNKIKAIYPGIESDEVYPKALRKGANYLRDLIEAATPIRDMDTLEPQGKYNTKSGRHKKWHPPGQAKRNVIVYKRKGKSLYQGEINANVSLLIGYEKRMAYYMYFREMGTKFISARPLIRPIFDAHIDEALEMALAEIATDLNKRIKVA
jgi:HK97 gp10 family phage protein